MARRFICDAPLCRRRIFAERFGYDIIAERSRRTSRLDCIVHHLGLALSGRPATRTAKRLMVPASNDTLLRVVRRRLAHTQMIYALSALMIRPSGAIIATARSSAIWNGGGS